MKKVKICPICGKPYRENKMYKVKLERKLRWFKGFRMATSVELICPFCNRQAGYRSRKKDFEKGGK